MKRVSYWAKHHPKSSRLIITICQALIYLSAMYTGALLEDAGIHIPATVMIIFSLLLVTGVLLYNRIFIHKHYWRKKAIDFLVCFSTFICLSFYYNDTARIRSVNAYTTLQGSLFSNETAVKDSVKTTASLSKKEMRERRKAFRKMLQGYQKTESGSGGKGGKIALTLLLALGSLLLLGAVTVLSCSLSCSGSDAAALIVGITGLAGVIWLFAWLCKRIWRKKPEEAIKAPPLKG